VPNAQRAGLHRRRDPAEERADPHRHPSASGAASAGRRADSPYVFTPSTGKRFPETSYYYDGHAVGSAFDRPGMDFYELPHFCATELLRVGVSHPDVAVQLGHTDGGALVMSTYGHPSEDDARDRLRAAFSQAARNLRAA